MTERGFIDLHSHYVPAVDDGVRTLEDGIAMCRGLRDLGYERVVATPHIRNGMFDNRRRGLEQAFESFATQASGLSGIPELGLGAEHFCDSLFWELFAQGDILPYPGASAVLLEFPPDQLPVGIEQQLFRLAVKGIRPVIAHPERYAPVFRSSAPIEPLLAMDVLCQLDLMSLRGKYGRKPRKAAERLLEEGAYHIAASDCHRPQDVAEVGHAIERLFELAGDEEARALLDTHPRQLLGPGGHHA